MKTTLAFVVTALLTVSGQALAESDIGATKEWGTVTVTLSAAAAALTGRADIVDADTIKVGAIPVWN